MVDVANDTVRTAGASDAARFRTVDDVAKDGVALDLGVGAADPPSAANPTNADACCSGVRELLDNDEPRLRFTALG